MTRDTGVTPDPDEIPGPAELGVRAPQGQLDEAGLHQLPLAEKRFDLGMAAQREGGGGAGSLSRQLPRVTLTSSGSPFGLPSSVRCINGSRTCPGRARPGLAALPRGRGRHGARLSETGRSAP
jgi:hypothetical protein